MLYKRIITAKMRFEFNKILILPVFAFILTGILSLLNADYPELVGLEVLRILVLMGMMLVIMNLKDEKDIDLFVIFLLMGIIVQGVIGLTQYLTDEPLGLKIFGE